MLRKGKYSLKYKTGASARWNKTGPPAQAMPRLTTCSLQDFEKVYREDEPLDIELPII